MHAVALSLDARTQRIDLCHEIAPGDIEAGAFLLMSDLMHLPIESAVAAVVDPGVGTERRILALPCEGNRWLVGPDNGLLAPAYGKFGAGQGYVVESVPGAPEMPSRTFHGRDLMTPAAVFLASGGNPEALGALVEEGTIVPLDLEPVREGNDLLAEIYWVDHFGTLVTNLDSGKLEGAVLEGPEGVLDRVDTFAEAEEGQPAWLIGSRGTVEIFVNNGSAAMLLGLGRGDRVVVRRTSRQG